jgi:hypothetical protein
VWVQLATRTSSGVLRVVEDELSRTSASVSIDGRESARLDHQMGSMPLRGEMLLGAFWGAPTTGPWKIRFDDYHCTTTP